MFYIQFMLLFLLSFTLHASETEQQVKEMLISADNYRQPFKSGELNTSITLYQQGEKKQRSEFFIQLNEHGDSRVTMLNQRSKGQKVLLTKSAMWLYIPRTHKAIRITPMQRLMGQASYGDVSSLNWQHDYQWDKQTITRNNEDNSLCFTINSIRKSATYRTISLCLAQQSYRPLHANFYLASGKLMKHAIYIIDKQHPQLITKTKFTQPNKQHQYTVMENSQFVEKKHNKHIFTCQGFIRK